VFPFGAESETPGSVLVGESDLQVVVEGTQPPHSICLPLDVVGQVTAGLEELNVRHQWQARVDPQLLCDRPDCAVYGRIGTLAAPNGVELRVWTTPTTSDSITFDALYLTDLIEGLRRSLQATGLPIPASVKPVEPPAPPPSCIQDKGSPASFAPIAPWSPLTVPGPIVPGDGDSDGKVSASEPAGTIHVGQRDVALTLHRQGPRPVLSLDWQGNSLDLPLRDLDELLSDVRALYYDALRGRRGRALSVGEYPLVTISIHNFGAQLLLELQQEIDGEVTSLSFPAAEVPTFLDTVQRAVR
jgi:hypothetical protein